MTISAADNKPPQCASTLRISVVALGAAIMATNTLGLVFADTAQIAAQQAPVSNAELQLFAQAAPRAPARTEIFEDLSPNAHLKGAPPPPVVAPQGPMGVFGITLGETTLRMPQCTDAGGHNSILDSLKGNVSTETCTFLPPMMNRAERALAERIAHVPSSALPFGYELTLIRLGAAQCPDWVRAAGPCMMAVTTNRGTAYGVSFLTGGPDWAKPIVKNLTKKYGSPVLREPAPIQCQNEASAQYGFVTSKGFSQAWQTGAVVVQYESIGGARCDQGRVTVRTKVLHNALDRNAQLREVNQPEM